MPYIKGENRNQLTLFPASIDNYVPEDSYVRVIDAFVDSLDMETLNFKRHIASSDGRPGYDPRDMLKLYIYGYYNKIRSSRRLQTECARNVELMFLLCRLVPDFRCIADFRKDNAEAIKLVFREFTRFCDKCNILGKKLFAIDGSKFKAVNSKDRNFTKGKLSDRIKWIDEKLSQYLSELDENDKQETPLSEKSADEIKAEIAALEERKERYQSYLDELIQNNETQKSLTDPESKLMKNNGKLDVCFNIQTAVDSESHIITDFLVTNHCTDNGLIEEVSAEVKKTLNLTNIESIADKGYKSEEDVKNCLLNGDIPNINLCDNQEGYSFELEHKKIDISAETKASTEREDIEKCLSAGIVPDVLEGKINVEIMEYTKTVKEENSIQTKIQSYEYDVFTRDLEKNIVYCPKGEIMRKKSTNGGKIRYANKAACKKCKNPCTGAKYKTVDFRPGQTKLKGWSKYTIKTEKINGQEIKKKIPKTYKKVKVRFVPDKEKLKLRKSIVEHPFGTVKRWNDGSYLLLKGKVKAGADLALSFLGYNLKRAINMLGVKEILAMI